jgi:hypothetical protein
MRLRRPDPPHAEARRRAVAPTACRSYSGPLNSASRTRSCRTSIASQSIETFATASLACAICAGP